MSDLIDRDALMKEFQTFVRRSNNHDYAPVPTWNDAVSLVGSMPSAESERKWTPAIEALPEEDEEVLVTVRFDGTQDVKPSVYVETASQIGGTWTSYSDEWKVAPRKHHVIAWMPLPEPMGGDR